MSNDNNELTQKLLTIVDKLIDTQRRRRAAETPEQWLGAWLDEHELRAEFDRTMAGIDKQN